MTPLRVILVMIEPPLPFGHAIGRWYSLLLRELVDRGHSVTAFAVCSKPEEIPAARALFPAPTYDLRLYPFPSRNQGLGTKFATLMRPYSYMFSKSFKADLANELASPFDVLHLDGTWAGWVGHRHSSRAIVNIHSVFRIDLADLPPLTVSGAIHRRLLYSAEQAQMRRYGRFIALSDRIAHEIHGANPQATVDVVPLGIDSSLYRYIPDECRTNAPVISMIGSMGWNPSYSAAVRLLTRLWPEIKRQVPDARVQVVGWDARRALAKFVGLQDVTIEENVSDIRPYFEQTGVMLYAPDRGSGMKVKVLEAFGFGVPVVTTSEGVEGIPALDSIHASICDDEFGLIARTIALLTDPARQNRQRSAARTLLESHCGSKPTVDAIERIYAKIHTGRKCI